MQNDIDIGWLADSDVCRYGHFFDDNFSTRIEGYWDNVDSDYVARKLWGNGASIANVLVSISDNHNAFY